MFDYYLTQDDKSNLKKRQAREIERENIQPIAIFDLPTFSSQKSFYGKSKLIETENGYYLMSYSTVIAYATKYSGDFFKLWDAWSATSSKHFNAFLSFLHYNTMSKKEWCNLPYCKLIKIN